MPTARVPRSTVRESAPVCRLRWKRSSIACRWRKVRSWCLGEGENEGEGEGEGEGDGEADAEAEAEAEAEGDLGEI